jgi:hypothetical protein
MWNGQNNLHFGTDEVFNINKFTIIIFTIICLAIEYVYISKITLICSLKKWYISVPKIKSVKKKMIYGHSNFFNTRSTSYWWIFIIMENKQDFTNEWKGRLWWNLLLLS